MFFEVCCSNIDRNILTLYFLGCAHLSSQWVRTVWWKRPRTSAVPPSPVPQVSVITITIIIIIIEKESPILSLEWPLAWPHPSAIMSSRAAHQTKLNYVCQHQLSCRLYNTNHSAHCTHKLLCSSNSNFHHLKPSSKSSCAKIKIVRANFPKESVFTRDNEPRNCEVLKWR